MISLTKPARLGDSKPSQNQQWRLLSNVLRVHGVWVSILGVVLAAASIVSILKIWKPVFEAKAYVRVIQNPEYFQVIPDKFQTKTDPKSELAPIKSDLVLNRVLEDEEVRKLPSLAGSDAKLKQLGRMISYRSAGGQELFEIVGASSSPKEAATLATKVTSTYLDFFREYRNNRLRDLEKDLSTAIAAKNTEIERFNQDLAATVSQRQGSVIDSSIYDPDGVYLTELQKTRTSLEIESRALQAERDLLLTPPTPAAETPAAQKAEMERRFDANTEVIRLKAARSQLVLQRQNQVEKGLGESHPDIKSTDFGINKVDRDLEQVRSEIRKANQDPANTAQQQLRDDKAVELDGKIAGLNNQVAFYAEEIEKQKNRIKENNQVRWHFESKQVELNRAIAEVDRLKDAESALHFRKLSLPYQIALEGPETIPVPDQPLELFPLKLLAIALALSLALPFGLAFLLEFRAQRISQSEQLHQQVPFGVVGEVAMIPVRRLGLANSSPRMVREQRMYQESVDKISTLLALTNDQTHQSIAIASAVSHEGKSTFSSQLAISLARSTNQRVLLIDADLRSPVQHRLFEISNEVGLVDALPKLDRWEDSIVETKQANLFILPSGKALHRPTRYFGDGGWEGLLDLARARFGIVIVDTPPVLSASEALSICRACDRTLLCVLRDISRAHAVRRAHDRLTSARVHVMGCVFGGISQNAYSYRYGGDYAQKSAT